MALIKTRPDVRLLLPRALVAGQIAEFLVELECAKPVPIDAVSLTLFGDVVWFTTSQYGRHRHSSRFLDHHVPLLDEETELEAGKHRLRTSVKLSEDLPGSWEGDRLAIEYHVKVHVDIPWWPDKRVVFVVRIAGTAWIPSAAEPETSGMVYVSREGGPPPKGPYLELSLGQRSVRPGGVLRLSAALGNVERNRYRKLHLAVLAQQSFPTGLGGQYVEEHAVGRWTVGLDAHPGELQPIPFSLDLPRSLTPAWELHGCKLRWILEVNADVAWGVDPKLRLPITVQPLEQGDEQVNVAAPLAVGSDRLRLIWSKVARDTGLELVDDRLRGARGGVAIEVRRSYDEGRARVLGLLEFAELGVGLRPHRVRRALLGSLETGLATRDEAQTRVVAEQLGRRIAKHDYELLEADDRRLLLALDGAGLELEPLQRFVAWLVELAEQIEPLPDKLPVPAVVAEHTEAWRRAARSLGGRLRAADLSVEVVREQLRLRVGCIYDDEGALRSICLELDPQLTIPSRQHLFWTGDTVLPEHELPLSELVAPPSAAPGERVALHIEADRVRVLLPAPLPDPLIERERIEALFALGRRLHGGIGPYR